MITLKDIARETGVAKVTVSYVLSGQHKKARISEETCAKVRAAAERMGYSYDDIARAMSTGRANVIGFTVPETPLEFVYETLSGALQRAAELGYFIKIISAGNGGAASGIINVCRTQKLSGIICRGLNADVTAEVRDRLSDDGAPAAVVYNSLSPDNMIKVMPNDRMGGALAAEHLRGLGHRRIAYVSNNIPGSPFCADRLKGFSDKMAGMGLEPPEKFLLNSQNKDEIGEFAVRVATREKDPATAIFCMSDFFALTVISSLQRAGLRVPGDISVAGYANMLFCEYDNPSITSVAEPHREIGARAVERIVGAIKSGGRNAAGTEVLDVKLIARGSSGPAPERRAK
jgi:LacI family transcriptional regulator